ncbi:hypothetical protein [Cylindrospermopsis raciborskii]|uniref:hypothetical protein n=1 Tax=Cylindrospermopsis raciborskii TaxID=77022 RepID=UPI0015C494E8|nr:hypothetical protein [Cylindrospermopsis raciborskii]
MGDSPVLPPSNFPLRMSREVYWGTTRYGRSHLPTFSFSKIAIAFLTALKISLENN